MKRSILFLFLISGYAHAQVLIPVSRRDSIPSDAPMDRMPNSHPGNLFYRDSRDPQNVVLIAILLIGSQTLKAARINPAHVLKSE